MFRFIVIMFLTVRTALAATNYDREQCTLAYNDANKYLAQANGQLWKLYERGIYSYDWYTFAHNRNTSDAFDPLWRINRASRIGTAEECWRDNWQIKNNIDYNMRSFK